MSICEFGCVYFSNVIGGMKFGRGVRPRELFSPVKSFGLFTALKFVPFVKQRPYNQHSNTTQAELYEFILQCRAGTETTGYKRSWLVVSTFGSYNYNQCLLCVIITRYIRVAYVLGHLCGVT